MTSAGAPSATIAATIEGDDAVGGERRKVEVVEDGKDAAAGRGVLADDLHDEELMGEVEAAGRLVEEQVAGAGLIRGRGELDQRAGEMDPLLFAAGERRAVARREAGETYAVERPSDEPVGPRARDAGGKPEPDHLVDPEGEGNAHRLGEDGSGARQARPAARRQSPGRGG